MADELEAALEQHPDNPGVLYNLACAEAQAGRVDDALAHLRRALELQPAMKEWADTDEDLAPLRERGLTLRLDVHGHGTAGTSAPGAERSER